jgi:hypothetical protein
MNQCVTRREDIHRCVASLHVFPGALANRSHSTTALVFQHVNSAVSAKQEVRIGSLRTADPITRHLATFGRHHCLTIPQHEPVSCVVLHRGAAAPATRITHAVQCR